DQALVLQKCMLRNVAIRLAQQISDEAIKVHPRTFCVIRAVQKIVWASGCGTVQLVFSSNEEISKIYEKTNAAKEPDVMTLPSSLTSLHSFDINDTEVMAQEQFFLMATRCCMGHRPLLFFITSSSLTAKERAKHAGDYFTLLRHLLNYAYNSNINLPNAEVLLNNEIDWLKRIRDEVKRTGETGVEETILEGHLGVTKELLAFQTPEKKYYIGTINRQYLKQELIDDFIFPASNVYLHTPASINAGFELLVALAVGCVRNLKQIVDTLTDMYYLGCETLTEWEYLPPNAGATCYMNSVIQQLYISLHPHGYLHFIYCFVSPQSNVDPRDEVFIEDRKEYNIGVLRHLQVIFGHLAASRLQYYVPRGFWKQFSELAEQHDALEFFNSLGTVWMKSVRYECEESFKPLNVDIRNHQNLLDSMEQYVKGDLLEEPMPTTVRSVIER
uniref:Peptidase C19 ubiquitin carboxyl-terminal hydrolase domain-containing protein n=1 Tax=Seriola dumerili TaxID=41447 RepID=A0A3B4U6X7_SERDU